MNKAYFGAGCFWGVEFFFEQIDGVIGTRVGYMGGITEQPTYEQVKSGKTGHAEVVEITYQPEVVSYTELLNKFFECHDPTTLNKQGIDEGTQYRSVIFCEREEQEYQAQDKVTLLNQEGIFKNKIVTQVKNYSPFYEAEEYHQKYVQKNGTLACGI